MYELILVVQVDTLEKTELLWASLAKTFDQLPDRVSPNLLPCLISLRVESPVAGLSLEKWCRDTPFPDLRLNRSLQNPTLKEELVEVFQAQDVSERIFRGRDCTS